MDDKGKELKENKEKLIQKVKDRLKKEEERKEIRAKNMEEFKRYDMMDFERTKFEIIQKSSKKFQKITEDTKEDLLKDINSYNFSKIIEEIVKNILESKFDLKDIPAMIIVISEMNQIYDKFIGLFLDGLKKSLSESYVEMSKPSKNDEEEEKKLTRRKGLTRMLIDCYLYGLMNDFAPIKEIFAKILSSKNTKEQFFQEFPVLVYIMKVFALTLFGFKSKKVQKLIDDNDIPDFQIETLTPKNINEKYYAGFKGFYTKKILVYLEEEHKNLNDLEKENFENVKKVGGENNSYQKARNSYSRYISQINEFAEVMNFEIPELANEKTYRYELKKKAETKLEKINKYDPFCNENEYKFYTTPFQIPKDDSTQKAKERSDSSAKIEKLVQKCAKCDDSRESVDEVTNEAATSKLLSTSKNRKTFLEFATSTAQSNYNVVKYFVRLIWNLTQLYEEFPAETVEYIKKGFLETKDFEEKVKYSMFISETVKFGMFPMDTIFEILKGLKDDFSGHSIDILCHILDHSGRYLYLNESSHIKFSGFIDEIKKISRQRLVHDERSYNSLNNSINICKPQEKSLHKKVKIRSIEEEYIRFLIYHILNKDTVVKVSVLLRRMDWSTQEATIFRVIFKYLVKSNENQIKVCCELISRLKQYQPNLIYNLINIILEEIRIGLERNDFNENQHKITLCIILAHFYLNKIVNNEIVYITMYMIILFNPGWNNFQRNLIADNPLDSSMDTFRILMIVSILEICGTKLARKEKKEKLDEFNHFFQIYILTKQYLPLDIENRVITCLQHLSNYQIYNDFHSALVDSKNYKGLNFVVEEEEKETAKVKKEQQKPVVQNEEKVDDDQDFKRTEEKKFVPINIDNEIQKIIVESLSKIKGSNMNNQIIDPLGEVKKKDLNKLEGGKFRLITKKDNKIVMKEIDKKKPESQEEDVDFEDSDSDN